MASKSKAAFHRNGLLRPEVPAKRSSDHTPPAIGEVFNPYGMFMGVWIPEALLKYPGISASAKLLFGRLARFAGKDGRCFPSVERLANELGISARQVQRLIRQLCEAGFLRKDPQFWGNGSQTSNSYFFLYHPSLAPAGSVTEAEEHKTQEQQIQGAGWGDKNVTPSADVHVTGGVTSEAPLEDSELNELNTKNSTSSSQSSGSENCVDAVADPDLPESSSTTSLATAELYRIGLPEEFLKIMDAFIQLDYGALRRLWSSARQILPDTTPEEVRYFFGEQAVKVYRNRRVESPVGLLLSTIPDWFVKRRVLQRREERQREGAQYEIPEQEPAEVEQQRPLQEQSAQESAEQAAASPASTEQFDMSNEIRAAAARKALR